MEVLENRICLSEKCCGRYSSNRRGAPKEVPKGTRTCPDCRSVLISPKFRNHASKSGEKNRRQFLIW